MYHTKPVVPGPDNLVILGHNRESARQRPSTATRSPTLRQTKIPQRPKTAPVPKFRPIPKLRVPTPQECWSRRREETDLDFINEVAYEQTLNSGYTVEACSPQPSTASTEINWPLPRDKQINSRNVRIQSAKIHRNQQTSPKRPVKSAGPVRSKLTSEATAIIPPTFNDSPSFDPKPPPCPQTKENNSTADIPLIDDNGDIVPDYEEEKERYGWGVEVHGNPYKFKKIPRRLPYTIKLDIPEVAPEPPRIHMETNETFFLNTIPRRPENYTIHKDWVSEVLHAKRMELQKREGIKYRWKNFAFVY
ncbi:hypothetical protein LOTGIDRAFT_175155 [Lottia gigantea]|uniref:Uncharacterized protein n=1 Tax=Lottia gigantea TaxID=225164 RepID=V4AFB4_LOTGI|nr:hypothetical protein LOTGIDRAFT_175155 [Lottia gigantea]ESO95562.1 hypothetical protein LOTGIDRAFT_175155 [Lottia gigantea]